MSADPAGGWLGVWVGRTRWHRFAAGCSGTDAALTLRAPIENVSGDHSSESSRARFVRVLGVPRNARIGAVVGVLVSAFAYVSFVLLPGASLDQALSYLVLAFVILVSTAALVTLALTLRTAVRMTMSPPRWIRRSGTAALAGGAVWAVLAAAAPLAASTPVGLAVYGWLPVFVLGPLAGAWGVHVTHHDDEGFPGLAGALLAGIGLLFVGWLAASDPAAFLGRPVRAEPRTLLATLLLALAGTWLVGADALRVGRLPTAVSLAALFALPVALAGLTVLAAADLGSYSVVPTGIALGGAWAAVGYALRTGRGVPPAEAFETPDPIPGEGKPRDSRDT